MTDYRDKLKYIVPTEISKCIFCGAPPPLTGEHIFPKWSHKYLPPETEANYESLRGIREPEASKQYVITRAGDIRHWKVPCVCSATCNNGWMRTQIEDRVREFLIPLIEGKECRIMPAAQVRIAAWAVLKAMVAEWMVPGHATTNHMQRKRMMRLFLPPRNGWGVWIGHFISDKTKPKSERFNPLWESHPFLVLPDHVAVRRPDKKATFFNSQASTQVIGQLLIHTFRCPMPNLIPRWSFSPPDRGMLFRIWPPTNTSIVWPAKALSDLDAIMTANAFMAFMLRIQRRERATPTRRD